MKKGVIFLVLSILFFLGVSFWDQIYPYFWKAPEKVIAAYSHPLIPNLKNPLEPINVSARAYILVDVKTNTILLKKNENEKIFPASITKLVTGLTALNLYPLNEVVTVANGYNEGKVAGFLPGEKFKVIELIRALMVYSANDAAYILGNSYIRGMGGFVGEMNNLAKKYGLKNSHFVNTDGIHDPNHYSTAYDLSQIARLSVQNQTVVETVNQKKIMVTDESGKSYSLESTNELLGKRMEIIGLKTGWTPEAGGCFAGYIDINGNRLISIVIDSKDRFADTEKIINWAERNVVWEEYGK